MRCFSFIKNTLFSTMAESGVEHKKGQLLLKFYFGIKLGKYEGISLRITTVGEASRKRKAAITV
jgi:hypothetical protein